jgi:hypothetical protein
MRRIITGAMRVSEAMRQSPDAPTIFSRHGFDPRLTCGALMHHMHLRDLESACGLEDTDQLIEELRASDRT